MMILYPFVAASILFISCTAEPAKTDCAKFKTGEFFIKSKNGLPAFSLQRTDSFQYVTDEKTGDLATYQVKWKGDCEYDLLFTGETRKPSGPDPGYRRLLDSLRKKPLTIRIMSTADNYYVFEVKRLGVAMIVGDTAWVDK